MHNILSFCYKYYTLVVLEQKEKIYIEHINYKALKVAVLPKKYLNVWRNH